MIESVWLDTDKDALRAESPLADLTTRHDALSVQEFASTSDVALGQEGAREVVGLTPPTKQPLPTF